MTKKVGSYYFIRELMCNCNDDIYDTEINSGWLGEQNIFNEY
jgi:hypothetical protein